MNNAFEQEKYFTLVRDRYEGLGQDDENNIEGLGQALSDLSISRNAPGKPLQGFDGTDDATSRPVATNSHPGLRKQEYGALFSAMRKIREALVATNRQDAFMKDVYLFIIRAAIRANKFESYFPALSYLLNIVEPRAALLSQQEYIELSGYRALDMACRQEDLRAACAQARDLPAQDAAIGGVLKGLVHGNWVLFWRARSNLTKLQRFLVRPAEDRLRRLAISCISRVYFTIELEFLERCTNAQWGELTKDYGIAWQIEDQSVIVRRQKAR